jgi:hypothetical protein
MSIPIVTREEAVRLSKEKGITLIQARDELEHTSLRIGSIPGTKLIYRRGFPVRFKRESLLRRLLRKIFYSTRYPY